MVELLEAISINKKNKLIYIIYTISYMEEDIQLSESSNV